MTDVSVLPPVVEADYDADGTWTDVTDDIRGAEAVHGGARLSNPDRPTVASAAGRLILTGELDDTTRGRRFACRIRLGTRILWLGWMQEPEAAATPDPAVQWRLAGRLGEYLAQEAIVNQAARSIADTIADTALWTRIIGSTPTSTGLAARNLKAIAETARTGRFISQLAAVAGASAVERLDGTLRLTAATLAATPADTPVLDSHTVIVDSVRTRDRADRIRNQATTTIASTQMQAEHAVSLELAIAAQDNGPTRAALAALTFTGSVPVPTDGATYSGWMASIQRLWTTVWTAHDRLHRRIGATSQLDLDASGGTVTVGTPADGRVPVTVSFPAGQPPQKTYMVTWYENDLSQRWQVNTRVPPPVSQAPRYFGLRMRSPGDLGAPPADWWQFLRDMNVRVEVAATRTVGTPAASNTANALDSQQRWGLRPLEIPDWLTGNTDLQAQIDALGDLVHEHLIEVPLRQPDAAAAELVETLDAGDYVQVRIDDPARNINIAATCLVAGRALVYTRRGGAVIRFRCLETGAAPVPTAPAAPLLGQLVFSALGANYQGGITWTARGAAATSWESEWTVAGSTSTQTFNVPALRADTEAPIPPGSAVSVRVRGHNAEGAGAWSEPRTGTAPAAQLPVAAAPIVNIAAVAAGAEGTTASLSATLSGGTYDGPVTYSWSVTAGTLDDNTAAQPTWTRPYVTAATDVTIRLVVTVAGTGSTARAGTSDTADDDVVSRVTDVALSFGSATIGDQAWQATVAITDLLLPSASGGNPPLAYSLSPTLPTGLTFDAGTRTISGTPSTPDTTTTYTYTVTDTDGATASLMFAAAVLAAPPAGAPGTPRQFTLAATATSITADWQIPSAVGAGVSGYRARHRTVGTSAWTTNDVGATLTHTISGLTPATGYEVEVQAYGPGGSSAWVTGAITTSAAPPPSATDRLQLEDSSDTLLLENDDHLELEG